MLFDENGDREQIQFWIEAVEKEKFEEGIRIGEERTLKKQADIIRAMLQEGIDDSVILRVSGVTPEYLASLKVQFE